ncbi:class I SAM-dependent RNA methyltransferase [Sphingomonas sp. AX6]|uniref:class I SAM-dependent RNA methyltransferase n=1 Tax=Sphingomonas sp. AX6 TaxID=2653171 RepID=UPI0012F1A4C2|nr:class I SAM-dependent RNA methyltransferase [Sphingomonas sp. AX6]VXC94843.1 putative enzyme [Sphingomonas sp. AX6]
MSDGETIIRVAARGDGVTDSGRHAALAAPGDQLRADGIVVPGPHHATPPCRHFPTCGGCQLQHLDDESYGRFVSERILGALAAQGLEAPMRAPHLSPPKSRRRATLHAERRGNVIVLGFSEGSGTTLIDLVECHVVRPEIFRVLSPLRTLLQELVKPKRRADIHVTIADQGLDILIKGVSADGLSFAEQLPDFAIEHGIARFAIDDGYGPETRWEPEPVTITLGGVPVALPHAAFLQATEDGEAALIAAVREAVGDANTVADLFAGLGTFALNLPGKIYAGEAGREPVLALKAAAMLAARTIFADHRDLYRRPLTPAELDRFDALVLDPPRAGAREQITNIAESNSRRVAYVSCNPSSFARDAKILCEAGFIIDWVQPVGQFRWSTHVELAAQLTRQG